MIKAQIHLVKYCLDKGCSISVWDEEEWQVVKSRNYNEIIEAIDSVDMPELNIYDLKDNYLGWVGIINDRSMNPEETVYDYSGTTFLNEWDQTYMEMVN
jgi:hypothetical protein